MTPSIVDALRDPSGVLARLADPLMKSAQIRWNYEEQFRYNLMVDQLLN